MAVPILPILGSAIIGKAANFAVDKAWQAGKDLFSGGLVPNGAVRFDDDGNPLPSATSFSNFEMPENGSDSAFPGIPQNTQELVNQGFLAFTGYNDEGPEGVGPGPRYAELVASMQADPAASLLSGGVPVPSPPTSQTVTNPTVTPLPTVVTESRPATFGPDNIYAPVDFGGGELGVPALPTSRNTSLVGDRRFAEPSTGEVGTAAQMGPQAMTLRRPTESFPQPFVPNNQGFTSFVPDTMGLSGDVSKSLFDQATLFEKQASEFDLSPVLSAGADKFKQAKADLAARREQRMGNLRAQIGRNRLAGSTLAQAMEASEAATWEQEERRLAVEEASFSAATKLQELSAKAGLMQQASAARTQAFTTRIDTMIKTATLGMEQAKLQGMIGVEQEKVRASLIDSGNKLSAAMAEIRAAADRTRMTLMQQEAANIRNNLTSIRIANEQGEAAVQANRDRIDFERDQGLGGLVTPLVTPLISGIGEGIADKFFGGWGEPTITSSGPVWYR